MNTTLRTSIHKCFVTREAFVRFNQDPNVKELDMMSLPSGDQFVSSRVLVSPHFIDGGHIFAVFELTERVETIL